MTACFEKPERSCYNLTHYARLVPECHVIFITPPGCSRIIRLSAIEEGVSDRFTIFNLEQADVIAGSVEDIIHAGIGSYSCQCDDTLMRVGAAHAIQLAPVSVYHYNSLFTGGRGNMTQCGVRLTLHNENLINGNSGTQSFYDCVAAFNHTVIFCLNRGGTAQRSAFFHGAKPPVNSIV